MSILSQGPKITPTKYQIYAENDLFHKPLVVSNAQGIPLAHNAIADDAQKQQVKIATQRGLEELHDILINVHGPLSHAQTPGIGEPTVLQITIQSAVLFSDPDWHQILPELLPAEFLGFTTGPPIYGSNTVPR